MQNTVENKKYIKKLSVAFILLSILFVGVLLLLGVIIHEVFGEKEINADLSIFNFLSLDVIGPHLTAVMGVITIFASSGFLAAAYSALIIFYLLKRNYKRSIEISIIGIAGFLINRVMKLLFHRVRPAHPLIHPLTDYSFPSGHATSGIIFYGLVAYLVCKSNIKRIYKYIISAALILFSLIIGCSRIYLRMHYPSDVIGGFCVGAGWLAIAIGVLEYLENKASNMVNK